MLQVGGFQPWLQISLPGNYFINTDAWALHSEFLVSLTVSESLVIIAFQKLRR